jgi:hypothetical protein
MKLDRNIAAVAIVAIGVAGLTITLWKGFASVVQATRSGSFVATAALTANKN